METVTGTPPEYADRVECTFTGQYSVRYAIPAYILPAATIVLHSTAGWLELTLTGY